MDNPLLQNLIGVLPSLSSAPFIIKMSHLNLDQLWHNTQEELKVILAPAVFQTFVAKTQLISLKDNQAVIACPNSYLVDMNHRRYYDLFKSCLDNQTKTNNNLSFIVQDPIVLDQTKDPGPLFTSAAAKSTLLSPAVDLAARAGLHPQYTFENFIVGNSNNFAFAAAQGIIKNPGLLYNPFFIWGGVGVGKTHLMQAIGHHLLKSRPGLKIKYFPAETFGNELINALKTKTIASFKNKYRDQDCILVDDIQFIAGKEYIQEEFFHTFNSLYLAGKQVILTSDRKPSEIDRLEDRLVSRFMGGLTVDIQPPDFEMRIAIIKQKAQDKNVKITNEAANFLAENLTSSVREIEGRLQQLIAQFHSSRPLNSAPLDLNFAQSIISPSIPLTPTNGATVTPRHLISVCAKYFNLKTGDLVGPGRQKDLVFARHLTAYLLLTESKLPLEEVGRLLGGRDHTSIMHARDKVHSSLSTNPQLNQLIHQIKASL